MRIPPKRRRDERAPCLERVDEGAAGVDEVWCRIYTLYRRAGLQQMGWEGQAPPKRNVCQMPSHSEQATKRRDEDAALSHSHAGFLHHASTLADPSDASTARCKARTCCQCEPNPPPR
jgi:hypothetical protein